MGNVGNGQLCPGTVQLIWSGFAVSIGGLEIWVAAVFFLSDFHLTLGAKEKEKKKSVI